MANVIQVIPEGKKTWKVLVDYIQRGSLYHTSSIANQEASKIYLEEYPDAQLVLYKKV